MGIKTHLKQLVPKPIRAKIRSIIFPKSPVLWANYGTFSKLIAQRVPTQFPPVLIISIPRSGSSWVGEVLGFSKNSLYLREPITTTYMNSIKGLGPSFFEIVPGNVPPIYKWSADAAFIGLPTFNKSKIVNNPEKWSILSRTNKRVVIKEVNPLSLEWFIEQYMPRIIYLVRHPAAVANSFYKKGWTQKQFERRFSIETLNTLGVYWDDYSSSFFEEFGALQAFIFQNSIKILRDYSDYMIVRYEELCTEPINTYRKLYNFADLDWDGEVERKILKLSEASVSSHTGSSDLNMKSNEMLKKWQEELPEQAIKEIKGAYLSINHDQYYNAKVW